MAFLEQFSEEEKNLLSELPYKAGAWVSQVDSTGGFIADEKELDALENILIERGNSLFESAFVHEVMSETYLQKDEWLAWAKSADNTVLDDCKKAVSIITGKVDQRDVDAYKKTIMAIGFAVAQSFREFDVNESAVKRFLRGVSISIDKFIGAIRKEDYVSEQLLNISFEEDLALAKLAKALGHKDGME